MRNYQRGENKYDPMEMIQAIRQEIAPLVTKVTSIEDKVGELYKDRVTRGDLEKLSVAFVPRDAYEARHAQLIERDKLLEDDIRAIHDDILQRSVLIQGRLDAIQKNFDDRLSKQQAVQLSEKDRTWLRISQTLGLLGVLGALLEFFFSHIHIQ